jgi:hypothetical protein
MFRALKRPGAHIPQGEIKDWQAAMLQKEQDMSAVGDGLATENDAHTTWTRLQAETRFGRWNCERRGPYRPVLEMNGHSCFSFSLFKAFSRAPSHETIAHLALTGSA